MQDNILIRKEREGDKDYFPLDVAGFRFDSDFKPMCFPLGRQLPERCLVLRLRSHILGSQRAVPE